MLSKLLQFNTPGPFVIITLTILLLHLVSANLLTPKFIATLVSIGPVAATVGILFWGWLWGVMGLLLAMPLTAFVKLIAGLASILKSLIQRARTGTSSDSTLGAIWRNGFAPGDSLLARPPGSQTRRKRFTGWT